jgi:hypothetical protein
MAFMVDPQGVMTEFAAVEYAPAPDCRHPSAVVPDIVQGLAALLVFRESRYDPCVILRGTPASENALIACSSILPPDLKSP